MTKKLWRERELEPTPPDFPILFRYHFLTNLVRKWWASREAAGSTWRMMPRPFCHGVTVPLGWAEIGRRWTKPTRCWEARNGTSRRGEDHRWCGRKVGGVRSYARFWGGNLLLYVGCLWLETGWFLVFFFFFAAPFLDCFKVGWLVGFHRICFKFQVVGPFFWADFRRKQSLPGAGMILRLPNTSKDADSSKTHQDDMETISCWVLGIPTCKPMGFFVSTGRGASLQLEAPSTWSRPFKQLHPWKLTCWS